MDNLSRNARVANANTLGPPHPVRAHPAREGQEGCERDSLYFFLFFGGSGSSKDSIFCNCTTPLKSP